MHHSNETAPNTFFFINNVCWSTWQKKKKTCIQEIILTCLAQGDVCAFQRRPLFGEKCERNRSVLRVSSIDWLDFFFSFFPVSSLQSQHKVSEPCYLSLQSGRKQNSCINLQPFHTLMYGGASSSLLLRAHYTSSLRANVLFSFFYDNMGFTGRVRNVCFDVHTLAYRWARAEEGEEESGIVEDGIKRGKRRHWWRRGRKGKMRKCKEPETYQETTGATN